MLTTPSFSDDAFEYWGCQLTTTIIVGMHIIKTCYHLFHVISFEAYVCCVSCMCLCLVTLYLRGTFEHLHWWITHAKTVIPNVKMHQLADI